MGNELPAGVIKQVLRVTLGESVGYVGDTAEYRRIYPDAVPVSVQNPTYDQARNGVKTQEITVVPDTSVPSDEPPVPPEPSEPSEPPVLENTEVESVADDHSGEADETDDDLIGALPTFE